MPKVLAKIDISMGQLAEVLKDLKKEEIEELELILDHETSKEIISRLMDIEKKRVKMLKLEEIESFKELD